MDNKVKYIKKHKIKLCKTRKVSKQAIVEMRYSRNEIGEKKNTLHISPLYIKYDENSIEMKNDIP